MLQFLLSGFSVNKSDDPIAEGNKTANPNFDLPKAKILKNSISFQSLTQRTLT